MAIILLLFVLLGNWLIFKQLLTVFKALEAHNTNNASFRGTNLIFLMINMGSVYFTKLLIMAMPKTTRFRSHLSFLPLKTGSFKFGLYFLTVITVMGTLFIFISPVLLAFVIAADMKFINVLLAFIIFGFGLAGSVLFAILVIEFFMFVLNVLFGSRRYLLNNILAVVSTIVLLTIYYSVLTFDLIYTNEVPVLMAVMPTYWSAYLFIEPQFFIFMILILYVVIESLLLYLLIRHEKSMAFENSIGLSLPHFWVKTTNLSFLLAQNEFKSIFRDKEIFVGQLSLFALIATLFFIAIRKNAEYLAYGGYILIYVLFLELLMLCHSSYGRYLSNRNMKNLPVLSSKLLLGKISGSVSSSIIFTLLFSIPFIFFPEVAASFVAAIKTQFLFVPVIALSMFLIGIFIPYRKEDPLVSVWIASLFLVVLAPSVYVLEKLSQNVIQHIQSTSIQAVLYASLLIVLWMAIYLAHKKKENRDPA